MSNTVYLGKIIIDGEKIEIDEVFKGGYLPLVRSGKREYYVAESSEAAGQAARRYWKELAENDPDEFVCLVGKETLVKWALGQHAGPGYSQVCSLDEWLDLWLDTPEEEFAGYDGDEREVEIRGRKEQGRTCTEALRDELGFFPTVAYRHN